jgi:hypothetical protein
MKRVDNHSRAPSGGDSDFERRVELYALEGQLGRSENSQLTFGQVTDRLVDGWWLAVYWVQGPIPLLPVSISRQRLERGPRPTKQPYLFRGRMRCGFCLRRLEGSTRQTRTYYRCAARSIVPGAPALAHHQPEAKTVSVTIRPMRRASERVRGGT